MLGGNDPPHLIQNLKKVNTYFFLFQNFDFNGCLWRPKVSHVNHMDITFWGFWNNFFVFEKTLQESIEACRELPLNLKISFFHEITSHRFTKSTPAPKMGV